MSLVNKKIISLLGGPGSGKGTVSSRLLKEYDLGYMSAGDLLRKEAEKPTEQGKMLSKLLKEGTIVPQHITIGLLKQEIASQNKDFYLIDGFPRAIDQANTFEKDVKEFSGFIFLDASDDVLIQRLKHRSLSSGRSDDNEESIRKRIEVFHNQSYPVIEMYEKKPDVVFRIDASKDREECYAQTKRAVDAILGKK